jgi:hypothetical protein
MDEFSIRVVEDRHYLLDPSYAMTAYTTVRGIHMKIRSESERPFTQQDKDELRDRLNRAAWLLARAGA